MPKASILREAAPVVTRTSDIMWDSVLASDYDVESFGQPLRRDASTLQGLYRCGTREIG